MSGPNPPGRDFPEGADLPGQEPGSGSGKPEHQRNRYLFAGLFGPGVRTVHQRPLRARRFRAVRLRQLRTEPDCVETHRAAALAVGGRGGGHRRGHRTGRVRFGPGDPHRHRQPRDAGHHDDTSAPPPVQDEITTTTPPPPPPPPPPTTSAAPAAGDRDRHRGAGTASAAASEAPRRHRRHRRPPPPPPPTTTTRAGPRQVTYSVTGTKAPGDIITVTYIDASGRSRTQRNVYIPWSLTVTPISQSEVGSVQASSLFLVSRLNCSITTSDGTVLSSNTNNSAQTAC